MSRQDIRLSDRYNLEKSPVLLNGTQALVRLMLMQQARDAAAGLNTAGLVTGYRGSPLGAVDMQMARAATLLDQANVTFQPGLNEDLAATALWGAQQAELRGEGKYDGVFGLWYGKGPGVDRSGDVFRHANMAGSSRFGGVLVALGDDHTGESSTTLHQSEWTMVDSYMPILSPAGVQEIIEFGLYGYALSRFSGLWVGLKCMKDTVEVTSVVDPHKIAKSYIIPEVPMPDGGLNIRLVDTPVAQEARVIDYRRPAAEAFAYANKIDHRVFGNARAKIGFVAAGKNWLDLTHALELLGIDAAEAERLGITTYKVGMTWPLDAKSMMEWADTLDLIVVIEEKRKLLEVQIKEELFNDRHGRRVYGHRDTDGNLMFRTQYDLNPVIIAEKLGKILIHEGRDTDGIRAGLAKLDQAQAADNAPEVVSRLPYFCSGCPHNSSTNLPKGARAYSGIGCHYMVQWMDRETLGFTQMGGEGANWIGEAPFSKRGHIFQNIGDGTYNHSGIQAIRAAAAAETTMTYKILYNDAVAMTGGQANEGGLDAYRIVSEVRAMGIKDIAVVYDPKEAFDPVRLPTGVKAHNRDKLLTVQEEFSKKSGVSVIVYVQTCAAEKRRRRKRGTFPDIDKRVFINDAVCEGCGDCGVQSNCVSIVPKETELGRKRAIDQSSCNKDFSCVNGFCPSFVTLSGAVVKKSKTAAFELPELPLPKLPKIETTYNVVITGVGGTGVVTIGAVLAMAAHVDGKGAGMMEMAGLAQKGGAVHIHCRLGEKPADISAIRVSVGEMDALIGGDLVVSAGAKTLGLMKAGRTGGVVNSHEIITGEFTKNTKFKIPSNDLEIALKARIGENLSVFDASKLAEKLLGDSIYSNMMIFGAAWQKGLLPLSKEAIVKAITLNGAAVEGNLRAFELGRWAVEYPGDAAKNIASTMDGKPKLLEDKIEFRVAHLKQYQNAKLAQKYAKRVKGIDDLALRAAVAEGYHKVLAYKDEYEVARLHLQTESKAREEFGGDFTMQFHLAPPILGGIDAQGRPKKRQFGPWVMHLFRLLAKSKGLRGTVFDPFAYGAERKRERALIAQYEADLDRLATAVTADNLATALEIARLPLTIKGFGPVRDANDKKAQALRDQLWIAFDKPASQVKAAE